MIDTIKLFPTVQPSGYPDKHDLAQKKLEKQHEMNKANELAKQKQTQLQDIGFEIYCKKSVQDRLRMEIFQNRKLDIYVWGYMDDLKGKLTFAVTLMVSATLCLVMLGIMTALLAGLYSADVDNAEIFKEITPVLQTITGGFIGLLAGIKLSHSEDKNHKCKHCGE